MSKRIGQQARALFQSTERETSDTFKTSETSDTSGTSEKSKGGRPPKDRPEMKRYTVILTPDQWEYLRRYAGEMLSKGVETDRSDVIRRMVDKLRAGEINPL